MSRQDRRPRGYNGIVIASAEEPEDPVEELLRLGERQGYLTYDMLNDRLPADVVRPDTLDALLMEIDRRGIRLIDESEAPRAGRPRPPSAGGAE
jgi:RNA polymerase primary sigma factor